MNRLERFDFIIKTATEVDSKWTLKEIAWFHAVNPNGLCAKRRAQYQVIDKMIQEKKVPWGWLMAYGILDRFHLEEVEELAHSSKKVLRRIPLEVALRGLQERIEQVDRRIAEVP